MLIRLLKKNIKDKIERLAICLWIRGQDFTLMLQIIVIAAALFAACIRVSLRAHSWSLISFEVL